MKGYVKDQSEAQKYLNLPDVGQLSPDESKEEINQLETTSDKLEDKRTIDLTKNVEILFQSSL